MIEDDEFEFLGADVSDDKPVEIEEEVDYSGWESAGPGLWEFRVWIDWDSLLSDT